MWFCGPRGQEDMTVLSSPEPRVYDSVRRAPAMFVELVEVWRYRNLVIQLVRRDIVTRYKRSVLGVAWTMLNPLGMMLVLTIAFSQVFGQTRAYAAYLLIGLLAWNFFAQATMAAMRQLVWGGSLIQRIYIPKPLFAISAIGTGLVNLVLSLVPLAIVILVTGLVPQPAALFLPVSIFLLAVFTLGVGLLLSAVAAYFPDVAEMYEIVLTAWMYLTPIIYPETIIPESFRWWFLNLNPMYHFVKLFRLSLYDGSWPSVERTAVAAILAFFALVIGWLVFTKRADDFAYRI